MSDADPIARAIAALTEAARGTRTIGAGTPNEHQEPADFGEIACYVLTAVAANIGSTEGLLAGRPGSWEADYVRQIINSTAGIEDAALLAYRTEPFVLRVDAEGDFDDFGLTDLYEEAAAAVDRAYDEADEALRAEFSTDAEKERLSNLQARFDESPRPYLPGGPGKTTASAEALALLTEAKQMHDDAHRRAVEAGSAHVDALAAAAAQRDALSALWESDKANYTEACRQTAQWYVEGRGARVGVELRDDHLDYSLIEWDLQDHVRQNAPLPMTGAAPDWSEGTPADALRRAGLTYSARLGA